MPGLTIAWEYLTGKHVATNPASRQRAEWPPHPGRVFMAMAAAWFETGEDEAEGQALRWLEKLGDPELGFPPRTSVFQRTVMNVFVPVNDVAGPSSALLQSAPITRSKQPRTFPSVWVGDAPCFLHWPNADTAEVQRFRSALDQLCGKVTRIGHSSSLVRMWVADEVPSPQPTESWVPDDGLADLQARRFSEGTLDLLDRQFNRRGREQHQLLSDRIAALKAEKKATTGKGSQQRKAELDEQVAAAESELKEVDPRDPIRPKLGLWTGYRRKEADPSPPTPHTDFDSDLLILTQVDGPRLPLASTLAVTQALRSTIIAHLGVNIPEWVSGHKPNGEPLRDGQQHLAFIPLPFVGHEHADGHLLGVGLVFPRGVPRAERGRVLGRFLVSETGQPRDVELTLGRLGVWTVRKRDWMEHRQALQPETWTAHPRGATTWASVTPVVLDRFPKCDPFKEREEWEAEVAGIITTSCERLGLPAPVEVVVGTTSWHRGSPRASVKRRPLRGHPEMPDPSASLGDGFPIYPTKGGNGARPQLHVGLRFAEPVVGPVLLGAGRFLGYGLCKPLWGGGCPMNRITLADFPAYFQELHGREPYDWQCRLVTRVIDGTWPGAIDLPTGSGKTSCLDIAVFALAQQAALPKEQRTAPRRIFFCVNRRVIVDEAHQRAVKIAAKIADADGSDSVLGRVAASLRTLSTLKRESAPPLDVLELRGGIYRDNRWARSATQPTIVCTTIDQLGSRLLFRGYGVSPNAAPIQAALIAYDSLVLLDEAHISRPFLQTLDYVKRYLDPDKWAEKPVGVKPMTVVPMTATPPKGVSDADVIRLEAKDRTNEGLNNRLTASKIAKLIKVPDVAQAAFSEATTLVSGGQTAVGIIVNRVATAKAIYEKLREANTDTPDVVIELVIGSMRPIDRDRQAERLRDLVGPDRPPVTTRPSFIVSTQCLEVGADYDFDALVTECASLDALRQRFGRLNRGGRPIEAKAVILAGEKDIKEESKLDEAKPLDPIYGNALSRTWNWLCERSQLVREEIVTTTTPRRGNPRQRTAVHESGQIDFGIDAFTAILHGHGDKGRIPANLLAPSASKDAPVMLPAYVDFWCQTSPRPTPDPEVSLFIHGPEAGEPDVQVCWRADLVEDEYIKRSEWCDVVSLLPPTSAECMSVPISRVRKWLTRIEDTAPESDLLGTGSSTDEQDDNRGRRTPRDIEPSRVGILWRGAKESRLIRSPDDLRPGDTLVLPAHAAGWDVLGHVPEPSPETIDVAETAFRAARDRAVLRLHPTLRTRLPESEAIIEFFERLNDPEEPTTAELRRLLRPIVQSLLGTTRYLLDYYPDERGVVLKSRERLDLSHWWIPPETDDGDDGRSQTLRDQPISLIDHTQHVRDETVRTVKALPLDELEDAYRLAAAWHDLGKADERFQAMLRRTDRTDAWLLTGLDTALLAKSDGLPQTREQRKQARERAGLPEGFRHEMLSVQIVELSDLKLEAGECIDIILHLIASHHGYARPFAPVVIDEECPEVTVNDVTLSSERRKACPPHRIDSGIAERFWALTRCYGWWGLAYLEAVLLLADHQASADEDQGLLESGAALAELAEATS